MPYKPTAAQVQAAQLMGGPATHILLAGGSRSGKTFEICKTIAVRALAAPGSRHGIFRFRQNAVTVSVVMDTWPKMMALRFPGVPYKMHARPDYCELGGSEIWFSGLDDKERTEKILGQEFATLFFNECSQIPLASVDIALTRLAQVAEWRVGDERGHLRPKAYYDENPPSQGHWTYKRFVRKLQPDSGQPLSRPDDYAMMYINPGDNRENLSAEYLQSLQSLPARMRRRFFEGRFAEAAAGALWTVESIEKARRTENLPDMLRIVVAVDPSGADNKDNEGNDAIGIVVAGLGMDGNGYVLEDVTCKAGPATWGKIATDAYDRWGADQIVAERNFGGAMVKFVIQSAKKSVPFKEVVASRGKAVRAEPISSLTDQGRVRFAGTFAELEEELCAMTTTGYQGEESPNRADAFVWAMAELFPAMVRPVKEVPVKQQVVVPYSGRPGAWM